MYISEVIVVPGKVIIGFGMPGILLYCPKQNLPDSSYMVQELVRYAPDFLKPFIQEITSHFRQCSGGYYSSWGSHEIGL
jgi:hypothetical protein